MSKPLIQLADDANWLAREIPLPDHPPPKHPPIYYKIDPETNRPVPRAGQLDTRRLCVSKDRFPAYQSQSFQSMA